MTPRDFFAIVHAHEHGITRDELQYLLRELFTSRYPKHRVPSKKSQAFLSLYEYVNAWTYVVHLGIFHSLGFLAYTLCALTRWVIIVFMHSYEIPSRILVLYGSAQFIYTLLVCGIIISWAESTIFEVDIKYTWMVDDLLTLLIFLACMFDMYAITLILPGSVHMCLRRCFYSLIMYSGLYYMCRYEILQIRYKMRYVLKMSETRRVRGREKIVAMTAFLISFCRSNADSPLKNSGLDLAYSLAPLLGGVQHVRWRNYSREPLS